jgi:hypothetical protein
MSTKEESDLRLRNTKAMHFLVKLPVDKDWNSKLTYPQYRELLSILKGEK